MAFTPSSSSSSGRPSFSLMVFLGLAVLFALNGVYRSIPTLLDTRDSHAVRDSHFRPPVEREAESVREGGGASKSLPSQRQPAAKTRPAAPVVVVQKPKPATPQAPVVQEPPPQTTPATKPVTVSPFSPRTHTDAGVDVSDRELYAPGTDLQGDSSTCTVMGMASGYTLEVYKRFVGSLRNSGFTGNIILGVSPNVSPGILAYFESRGVTAKILTWVPCTYKDVSKKNDIFQKTQCSDPYPDIKIRWSRFPLARDWLTDCEKCTGPVLVTDVRDLIFQRNPFGPGSPVVTGLQVFEEHKNQTTQHWLTKWPINDCKGVEFHETMLCSGSSVGTRAAMLRYLKIMYEEQKVWITTDKCRFDINGDDQSMHNYLFYSGQLPFATAIPNRAGGIVHTVGVQGAVTYKAHQKYWKAQGIEGKAATAKNFDGASGKNWIGPEYKLTDDEGFFTEFDGTRSRVIHQWDRFGEPYARWLQQQDFIKDPMPSKSLSAVSYSDSDPTSSSSGAALSSSGSSSHSTSVAVRRTETDTGVAVADPELYEGEDLYGDSSTATVMGMASGYKLEVYERFVGSLRKTGYKGHIILGVAPDISQEILDYFAWRGVTPKILKWVNCTYSDDSNNNDIFKKTTCSDPYPDIKIRWSRFPLARDWLEECKTCTGPVMQCDVRDMLFQRDPFGEGSPVVKGLQVFEEHKNQTTAHWITNGPIKGCKGVEFEEPMLCSGSTVGTRVAMLKYLGIMYEEMKAWISVKKCRFDMNGDDQSIHNYLFYSKQLPFATAMANRAGSIVNTAGVEGAVLVKRHRAAGAAKGIEPGAAIWEPFAGASGNNWIGPEYNLTNEDGLFTEFDGSVSRAIHQYDRFGRPYVDLWLKKQYWLIKDPRPDDFVPGMVASTVNERRTTADTTVIDVSDPVSNSASSSSSSSAAMKVTQTDTGVAVADSALYEGEDLYGDSSTATVMGMASGYKLEVYERFVGSLRKTGYKGHIILGVAPDVSQEILDYFAWRNVTPKILKWVDCTYTDDTRKNDIFKKTTCSDPYPDIKIRWSRFPMARDWLRDCKTCTGPVMQCDARDMLFQRDPFGEGSPVVKGLQVFEEHKNQTTAHWITNGPIKGCKGVEFEEPMLCSGSTVGTRVAMLKYLEIMYEEMKAWISVKKCRFDMNGDDQSIHNYLFYSGQLPFATAMVNRAGSIVNTAGFEGAVLVKRHRAAGVAKGLEPGDAMWKPFAGASGNNWIGPEYNLTNEDGLFTEFDGSVSRAIHQYDRFGRPYVDLWLRKQDWLVKDPMPKRRIR